MGNMVTSGMMTYRQGKKQDVLMLHTTHEMASVYLMLTPSKCLLPPRPKKKKKILHWAEVTIYDLPRSVCSRVQKELITYRVWILKNIRSSQFHLRWEAYQYHEMSRLRLGELDLPWQERTHITGSGPCSSLCKHLPLFQGTPWYKVSCDIFMGKTFLNGIFSPKMGTMQVWEGLKLCTHKRGRNIKFSVSLCLCVSLSVSLVHSHVYTYTHILSHPLPLLPFFPASVSHPSPPPSLIPLPVPLS